MHPLLQSILILVPVLSACDSGGGGGGRPPITATQAEINSFSVQGTSAPLLPTEPQPIDAGENGGRFSMSWDLSADGVIDVELAVRERQEEFPGPCFLDEYEFHDRSCGEDLDCQLVDSLSCQLSSDHRITCDSGKGVDLTPFLDQLPKSAVITITARAKDFTACDYVPVEFQ